MNYLFACILFISINFNVFASSKDQGNTECFFSNQDYKEYALKTVAAKMPDLMTYSTYRYPNESHEQILNMYPTGKILVFGYGSLMNKISASRTVKAESVDTMQMAVAFGVKRIFNYKASKTKHWQEDLDVKEKAMLNLTQTFNIASLVNGVTIEVDLEDFSRLVMREIGYDLVPILVVDEKDIADENPNLDVRVAYTFVAMNELRNHINYTSTKYYPVRGYLRAVQEAAAMHGKKFAKLWNKTTYMADGVTCINDWDQMTFKGILCTFEPDSD